MHELALGAWIKAPADMAVGKLEDKFVGPANRILSRSKIKNTHWLAIRSVALSIHCNLQREPTRWR